MLVLLGVGARLGEVLGRPQQVHSPANSPRGPGGARRCMPGGGQQWVRFGVEPVEGGSRLGEAQAGVVGVGQVRGQPVAGAFQGVDPGGGGQVEVQQPVQGGGPAARGLLVALGAGTGVEPYEVVEAVAAGRGRFEEGAVH